MHGSAHIRSALEIALSAGSRSCPSDLGRSALWLRGPRGTRKVGNAGICRVITGHSSIALMELFRKGIPGCNLTVR